MKKINHSSTLEECRCWVEINTPFSVESKRSTKKKYVSPFSSGYASKIVTDHLAQCLFELLKELKHDEKILNIMSQWTGLKDTEDVKIFEGDILRSVRTDGKCMFYKIWKQPGGFTMNCFQDDFYKKVDDIQFYDGISDMQTRSFIEGNCKVVGNIWDNPELMQKAS